MNVHPSSQNWADKTIWTGDNLHVMRGMNSASVDLIYLDPPFNSKTDYAAQSAARPLARSSRTHGRCGTWTPSGSTSWRSATPRSTGCYWQR